MLIGSICKCMYNSFLNKSTPEFNDSTKYYLEKIYAYWRFHFNSFTCWHLFLISDLADNFTWNYFLWWIMKSRNIGSENYNFYRPPEPASGIHRNILVFPHRNWLLVRFSAKTDCNYRKLDRSAILVSIFSFFDHPALITWYLEAYHNIDWIRYIFEWIIHQAKIRIWRLLKHWIIID